METALSLMGDDGPCSAKNMSFAQTAMYIRTLELRWMENQRRIHELERQLKMQRGVDWPKGMQSRPTPAASSRAAGNRAFNG